MQSKFFKRTLSVVLALAMLVALATGSILTRPRDVAAGDRSKNVSFTKVGNNGSGLFFATKEAAENFEKAYVKEGIVRVSIILNDAPVLAKGFSTKNIAANKDAVNYARSLRQKQDAIAEKISKNVLDGEKLDVVWNITMAGNIISANVPYNKIAAIKRIMGVKNVVVEAQYELYNDEANMATATAMTGTPGVWSENYTGAGSIVAIIDTGLDTDHISFDEAAFEYALELTGKEVDLLTVEDIDAVISQLHIAQSGRLPNITGEDLYLSSKLPFAANYVDNNINVSHMADVQGEHGSHVTGIAAANRFVPDGEGGFLEAAEAVGVQGQAPDAQVLVMKVFGEGGGAYDSDYVVAIEDAIMLGADAVNLSLGSAVAGFPTSDEFQAIFDSFTDTDTVVVISSGNNSYWAEKTIFGTLYNDDVNFATNGSPGSYANALTVASIENGGYSWVEIDGDTFLTTETTGYGNELFSTLAGEHGFVFLYPQQGKYIDEDTGKEVEGIAMGFGGPEEFASIADVVEGKIAVVQRGRTSFYQKVNAAAAAGAIGVIVVNNQAGTIAMNLTGLEYTIPAVSISQDSFYDFIYGAEDIVQTDDGLIYSYGTLNVGYTNEGFLMSDFSSWGVPGDLSLKPEISAPGGNIMSVNGDHVFEVYDAYGYLIGYDVVEGHDNYEAMSGTSMAAPQVTGLVALMNQYIRETGLDEKTGLSARKLANSLLMSTAVVGKNIANEYYSVMQQGAGLANIEKATTAKSYITIDEVAETAPLSAAKSIADGKIKIELGAIQSDSFDAVFSIHNFSDEDVEYYLYADFFTQYLDEDFRTIAVDDIFPMVEWMIDGEEYVSIDPGMYDFNGDGVVNMLDAQHILKYLVDVSVDLNGLDYYADFDEDDDIDSYDARLAFETLTGTSITVAAGETVQVVLTVSELEGIFGELLEAGLAGDYIEGYIFAREGDSEDGALGVLHSIPVFGFWGDWSAASMFDRCTYEVSELYDDEYYYPYMYYEYVQNKGQGLDPFDTQAFLVKYPDDTSSYFLGGNPLLPDEEYMPERNAINSDTYIKSALFTLIRNAGAARFFVNNKYGKTVSEIFLGKAYAAYYNPNNGHWQNTYYNTTLNYLARSFKDGDQFTIYMQAIPEYYVDAQGVPHWEETDLDKTTYSMSLVLDNEDPFIVGAIYDDETGELLFSAHDNQYIAAVALFTEDGTYLGAYGSVADVRKGEQIDYPFDLAELFDTENGGEIEPHLLVEVYDYALNLSTYKINLNPEELVDPELSVVVEPKEVTIVNNGSAKLSASVYPWGYDDETVYWESSDETVVKVDENGLVQSVYTGEGSATATITARSAVDETKFDTAEVTVIVAHKDLNGILWDENGDILVVDFDIATIPDYNILSENKIKPQISSMTYGSDGYLYAASLDSETLESDLYIVDQETWSFYKIGSVGLGIMDMCAAPNLGDDFLLAVYGPYVLVIDNYTGEFVDYADLRRFTSGTSLVGITYDENYQGIDYVLLLDADGNVYSVGFAWGEDDYLAHTRVEQLFGGPIADPVDLEYWQSLYYDAEEDNLYWSRFVESDDFVEMIMLQGVWSEEPASYSVGRFADKVWPVSGLFELETPELTGDDGNSSHHHDDAQLIASEKTAIERISGRNVDKVEAAPVRRPADRIQSTVTEVTVEIRADELSKNGFIHARVPVTATLLSTSTNAEYSAEFYGYDGEPVPQEMIDLGAFYIYNFAFVDTEGIPEGEPILTMKFAMGSTGTLVLITKDINDDDEQQLTETVILGVASAEHTVHTYEAEWDWSTDDNGEITATATLNCTLDDGAPEIVLEGEITREVTDNAIVYTASVELDGKTYTDTYEVGIARVSGRSANFGTELGVNFILQISDIVTADEDAYAVVSFNGKEYTYLLSDCQSGNQYKITKSFAVKEYADQMNLKIFTGDGMPVTLYDKEGNDVTLNGFSFSMLGYLNLAIELSTQPKMVTLAKAFHDYGLATAIYFGYNQKTTQDTFYNDLDAITLDNLSEYAPIYNDRSLETVTDDKATVTYSSKLILKKIFYFAEGTDVSAYKFYIDGVETEAVKVNDTQYTLSVSGIALKHYDDTVTFTVSDGQNSYEVEYSVLSYCYKALESGRASSEMVDLAKATYIAFAAAKDYFG